MGYSMHIACLTVYKVCLSFVNSAMTFQGRHEGMIGQVSGNDLR